MTSSFSFWRSMSTCTQCWKIWVMFWKMIHTSPACDGEGKKRQIFPSLFYQSVLVWFPNMDWQTVRQWQHFIVSCFLGQVLEVFWRRQELKTMEHAGITISGGDQECRVVSCRLQWNRKQFSSWFAVCHVFSLWILHSSCYSYYNWYVYI